MHLTNLFAWIIIIFATMETFRIIIVRVLKGLFTANDPKQIAYALSCDHFHKIQYNVKYSSKEIVFAHAHMPNITPKHTFNNRYKKKSKNVATMHSNWYSAKYINSTKHLKKDS